jgi:retinaldehyde-binding protein 1
MLMTRNLETVLIKRAFQMYFHGDDMKKLHKYIPIDSLPSNYGGTLPEINYSGKDWYPCVEKYNQTFLDFTKYGFK